MQWYSAAQVAKIWGSVTATVIARIEDGSLEAVNIGKLDGERRRWRVSEKSIAAFEQEIGRASCRERVCYAV